MFDDDQREDQGVCYYSETHDLSDADTFDKQGRPYNEIAMMIFLYICTRERSSRRFQNLRDVSRAFNKVCRIFENFPRIQHPEKAIKLLYILNNQPSYKNEKGLETTSFFYQLSPPLSQMWNVSKKQ